MNTRKEFLVSSSLFALAPAAAQAASPSPSPAASASPHRHLPFAFDQARFNEILATPAKHKQCFGATKIDGGNVITGMANSMNAYEEYLGERLQTVAVLYHGAAIAIAMSNSVWNDILFPMLKHAPKDLRNEFEDAQPGKGNPYLGRIWLPGAVARGASFFVCHNAIAGFASMAADALKQPENKIHDAIMAGIVPGALVVPAGVMAINACQEAKFTYIQSSL